MARVTFKSPTVAVSNLPTPPLTYSITCPLTSSSSSSWSLLPTPYLCLFFPPPPSSHHTLLPNPTIWGSEWGCVWLWDFGTYQMVRQKAFNSGPCLSLSYLALLFFTLPLRPWFPVYFLSFFISQFSRRWTPYRWLKRRKREGLWRLKMTTPTMTTTAAAAIMISRGRGAGEVWRMWGRSRRSMETWALPRAVEDEKTSPPIPTTNLCYCYLLPELPSNG